MLEAGMHESSWRLSRGARGPRVASALALALWAWLIAAPAARAAGPTIVSLEFDDGLAEHDAAGALVASYGMSATFFVNSGRLGASGYLTSSQVQGLEDDGHEIGGHTIDHVHLPAKSHAEQVRQVCDDRAALLDYDLVVDNFAYPFGDLDAASQQVLADCGYKSGRDVGGIVTPGSCSGCPYAESLPPKDRYATRTPGSIRKTTTLSNLKGYVTQAQGHGGGWVQIVMHHVCNGCDEYSVSQSILTAFLAWLDEERASGRLTVKTVRAALAASSPFGPEPSQNVSPRLVIYTGDRGGAGPWWAQGQDLAASAGWQQARWTAAPVPAEVALLSVGLELPGPGTLILDDLLRIDATP